MNYELIFDARTSPFPWTPIVIGLALVLAGTVMWLSRNHHERKVFAGVYLGFALLAVSSRVTKEERSSS